MTKKLFDNSNLQQEIEWGNIPVGNMTDEELHGTNWNHLTAMQDLAKSPEWRKKLHAAVKTEEFSKLKSEQTTRLWQDPDYKKVQHAAVTTPEVKQKQRAAALAREANPEFKQKKKDLLDPTYQDPIRNKKISDMRKRYIADNPDTMKELSRKSHEGKTKEYYDAKSQKRRQNGTWLEGVRKAGAQRRKPIMTPAGRFESKGDAAKHYKWDSAAVGYWLKKDPANWYYIEQTSAD